MAILAPAVDTAESATAATLKAISLRMRTPFPLKPGVNLAQNPCNT